MCTCVCVHVCVCVHASTHIWLPVDGCVHACMHVTIKYSCTITYIVTESTVTVYPLVVKTTFWQHRNNQVYTLLNCFIKLFALIRPLEVYIVVVNVI